MAKKESSKKVVKLVNAANATKKRVSFEIQSDPGSKVFLAGSFNNWMAGEKQLVDKNSSGVFQCMLMLEPGVYEYKFCINDTWCIDPQNPNFKPNDMGTLNSVIVVE